VGGYPCRRAACLVLWLSVCRRELRSFPTRRSSDLEEPFRPASQVFATGVKPVYRLITKEGFELRLTGDHRVLTERGWVEAHALKDRKSTRLNSSHVKISYAVFCLKNKIHPVARRPV